MKNLRNCYAAFLLFALLFVSAAAPAQTDLQQKLGRISAITETRPLESTRFSEKYVTYLPSRWTTVVPKRAVSASA